MYTKMLNKVVEFSTDDFLTYNKTINEKQSCMNKTSFRHKRKSCTFNNSCAPIIIKRKERSPKKGEGAGHILDREPYFQQTSMQTKQSKQKAQEKKEKEAKQWLY